MIGKARHQSVSMASYRMPPRARLFCPRHGLYTTPQRGSHRTYSVVSNKPVGPSIFNAETTVPSWSFAGGLYGSRRSTNEVVVAVWLVRLFRKIVTTAAVRVVVGTNELQPTPTRGGRRPVQLAAHGIGAGRDNEENPLGWSTGTELLVSAGGTIPPGTNCLGSNRSVCNEDQPSHSCCAACGRCAGRSLNVAAASRDLPASCGHAAAGTGHSKAAPAAASDTRARMVRSAAQTHWIANPRSSVESGKNQAIGRKYFSLRLGQRKEQQTADDD